MPPDGRSPERYSERSYYILLRFLRPMTPGRVSESVKGNWLFCLPPEQYGAAFVMWTELSESLLRVEAWNGCRGSD
jgi:hypothetical protein